MHTDQSFVQKQQFLNGTVSVVLQGILVEKRTVLAGLCRPQLRKVRLVGRVFGVLGQVL